MAFTVEDFQDLLQLLEQHPEWQAELRRQILTDELLELPALMRQLTERVDALAQRVDALTERMEALAAAQARTEERIATMADHMDLLTAEVTILGGHVAVLRGDALEARYHRHFTAYFGRLARRLRLVDASQLGDLLEDALDSRQLSEAEADSVRRADLVLSGRRPEDRAEVYLVVEVSSTLDLDDVSRASRRARLLEQLGRPALAVVAGSSINPEAARSARDLGVWQVLDGRSEQPELVPPSLRSNSD